MAVLPSITKFVLTEHARDEMARRQIAETEAAKVLASPDQIIIVRKGRAVYQSQFETSQPSKTYLLRVFVEIDCQPVRVVTMYRTSKIEKYWRKEE